MKRGDFTLITKPEEVMINEQSKLKLWVTKNDGKDYLVISPWVCYAKAGEKEPTWKPKVGEKGDGKTIILPIESLNTLKEKLEEVWRDYGESLL